MEYYIVIPAHNEEAFIQLTLDSLASQTILPKKVVVVNDNSTDRTAEIVTEFATKNSWISLVNKTSEAIHLPGSKVIQAFHKGFETLDHNYDIIVKLDADLILPANYFETILNIFKADPKVGMAGGFAYIEKNGEWILENLTDKDHIRGAFKAYRKECFLQIGNLKPAMGWDTVDELLSKFYGWKVVTDASLKVKHLKPTGANYNKAARYKQGEAFYTLGYGFLITSIASAKLAMMKKKPLLFVDYIRGFWKARSDKKQLLVTNEQARFIRSYRLQKMKAKIFR
ncbi:glycosyl transferase family 2 [Flavobacterium noncentrifugens]|uniref:Glycosyl transferase family 2 n=1 Tax=Flavobacterium noncentrifugens TaxID=1128970 RepID=A0A1G8UXK4_9FLAO|nr:glycosyltransferase family 2 protein [Flavobacterium noncentrifugens]GEP50252.1 glycosyl transferase family 2 [Flavobacterium noncentrifugens]SDJ58364.1 Glycosyl transferase family 2 [Flavobacterium noncentrifugens]